VWPLGPVLQVSPFLLSSILPSVCFRRFFRRFYPLTNELPFFPIHFSWFALLTSLFSLFLTLRNERIGAFPRTCPPFPSLSMFSAPLFGAGALPTMLRLPFLRAWQPPSILPFLFVPNRSTLLATPDLTRSLSSWLFPRKIVDDAFVLLACCYCNLVPDCLPPFSRCTAPHPQTATAVHVFFFAHFSVPLFQPSFLMISRLLQIVLFRSAYRRLMIFYS